MDGSVTGYIAAAVIMAVSGSIYGSRKHSAGKKVLVFKAIATSMALAVAVLAAWGTQDMHRWLIAAGVLLCMAADVLLELWFVSGVFAFGCAHSCLIASLISVTEIRAGVAALTAGMYLVFFIAFRRWIPKLGKLRIVGILYPLLLCSMAALAVGYGIREPDFHSVTMAVGGILFVISDFILVYRTLGEKKEPLYGAAVLIFYYSAVYLIAL